MHYHARARIGQSGRPTPEEALHEQDPGPQEGRQEEALDDLARKARRQGRESGKQAIGVLLVLRRGGAALRGMP